MFLGHLPRVPLAHLPSPLEEMRALALKLGGPHVCFIHTGGTPGLFAYRDCFAE